MISFIAGTGRRRFANCTRPTTSRNSLAGFVPLRAKRRACSGSTSLQSRSSKSKKISWSAGLLKAGSVPSRQKSAPGKKWRSVDRVRQGWGGAGLGARKPRGRELGELFWGREYRPKKNRRNLGDTIEPETEILATGKRVVIIGGGDTGADCLGTCHRQKPLSVHQFEIMPKPPGERSPQTPWPMWPLQLRIEGAHEEGGVRDWSIATVKFTGDENGHVRPLHG